jgi:hypothetical protein
VASPLASRPLVALTATSFDITISTVTKPTFHFSLRSILFVTTVVAVYLGGYISLYSQFYTRHEMEEPTRYLIFALPKFVFFCLAITWLFNRRHCLQGAMYAIAGLSGILLWDYLVIPLESWAFTAIYASTSDFNWLHYVRTFYYAIVPSVCWGLLLYAYVMGNVRTNVGVAAESRFFEGAVSFTQIVVRSSDA